VALGLVRPSHTLHPASDIVIGASTDLSRFRCVLAQIGPRGWTTAVRPYVAQCNHRSSPGCSSLQSTASGTTPLEGLMTTELSRRSFLGRCAATGLGIAVAGVLEGVAGHAAHCSRDSW